MKFNKQINLIFEGLRECYIPLTSADVKTISDSFSSSAKLINRYTAKIELMGPVYGDDPMGDYYGSYGSKSDDDLVVNQRIYVNHLLTGGWRVIYKKKYGTEVNYFKTLDYNHDPMHCDLHREDGPAVIRYNKKMEIVEKVFFLNGEVVPENLYWNQVKMLRAGILGILDV